ncbi:MAG: apolipoprotein N-acyltransferase [Syntrophales bacterium]|nr:apolipoprotein N-acyltransferase [Syntrophales bacterium]
MEKQRIGASSYFYAIVSGTLLFFSFPKFGSGLVAWIALLPLFYALKNKSLKQSFVLACIAGLVCHVGIMYWITFVVVNYGYLPLYMGIGAMLIVASYLSLYTGFFAVGVSYLTGRNLPLIVAAPVLWVCFEYVRSHILTGFPWENLGYSQYSFLPVIQISDITGVYGVSFLIVFINALVYDMAMMSFQKRPLIYKALSGLLVVGLVISYGLYRIDDVSRHAASLPAQDVSLIQGNVDQNIKWNPQFQHQTMSSYESLTLQAAPTGNRLIVWPETAVPLFFQDVDEFHRLIVGIANKTNSWLLFGSPSYTETSHHITLFNSAYLLSPDGRRISKYDKMHLVPYGEYVPLRQVFPFISKLVQGVGDFGTGKGYLPLVMDGHKIGILICYEGIFSEAGRSYKANGADLLVNITNDAWFGRTSAPYQHLSMTVFRAVENRLYLVRAANTGITAFIDPVGCIESQTGLFQTATLQGAVRFMEMKTFYGSWGDLFVYICGFILIVIVIIAFKRRKAL